MMKGTNTPWPFLQMLSVHCPYIHKAMGAKTAQKRSKTAQIAVGELEAARGGLDASAAASPERRRASTR
jgi:hypothetical protein